MRFDGEDDTLICDECGRVISISSDKGWEDKPLCSGCSARSYQDHVKTECALCNKPLREDDYCYDTEGSERLAHTKCVDKLPEKDKDNWSDNFG